MSYVSDGTRLWSYSGEEIIPSPLVIATAERRLASKKQVLEDMKNEYNLLEQQTFETYKNHIRYAFAQPGFIKGASDWLDMIKDGKIDKRKKYDEKYYYAYLTEQLQTFLEIDDMKIYAIYDFNFGEANNIYFTHNNSNWVLKIPNIDSINITSYQRYGNSCFKLELSYQKSEHCYSSVGKTFIEEELAEFIHSTTKEEEQ